MKIQLWCDDLVIRLKLESAWKAAGATMLTKTSPEVPECVVLDLAGRRALENIAKLRAAHPEVVVIAFAPEYDAELFEQAKAAGATELAARGSILERVTRRLRRGV